MALEVTNLKRTFLFKNEGKNIELTDPNPEFTVPEVMQFYSTQHPELTTCTIDGPNVEEGNAIYNFKTTIGIKG